VYRLQDEQAVVATTDFFMRLSMIRSTSDGCRRQCAVRRLRNGGPANLALAILGMPMSKISPATVSAILTGGAAICTGGRHSRCRRPFDRFAGAHLRTRRHWTGEPAPSCCRTFGRH